MRYKLLGVLFTLSLLTFFCGFKPVAASVFEVGSTTTLPLVNPDPANIENQIGAPMGDTLGNQYYLYRNASPMVLRKVTPDGQIAWSATLPVITYTHLQAIPDNLGGFFVIYDANVVRSNLPTVPNIFMLHYSSNGTYDVQNVNLLDSVFKLSIETNYGKATADSEGNLYIFFYEANHGDVTYKSSIKVLKVNTAGQIQNTIVTQPLNPTEKRWCTNRGSGPTVPYDLPYSGGASWSACWDWCLSAFPSTPGTCQYNADGVRNCWINAFPAGGVGNCTWTEFTPGYPPYSGYSGITLRQEPTVNETFYANEPLDNTYTLLWVEEQRTVSDGIIMYYRLTEFDYKTVPMTVTSGEYIQKMDFSGNKTLPGKGTSLAGLSFDDIDLLVDGFVAVESVDTDADLRNDTLRMQRYNLSGVAQFPGNGIDVFTLIEANTDIYGYLYTNAPDKIYYVIEAWNDALPSSMDKGFVQATDLSGSVLLGANGVQIVSSEDAFMPEYINEPWSDGNQGMVNGMESSGRIVPVWTFVTDGSSPLRTIRLYLVDGNDDVLYEDIGGLALDLTEEYSSWCYGNDSQQIACSVYTDNGDIEQQVIPLVLVNQITTSSGLSAIDISTSHDISTGTSYGTNDSSADILLNAGAFVIGGATVNMSSDRNWTGVTGESGANKAYISGLSDAPSLTYPALYVPRSPEDTNVLLCPDLTSGLNDIVVDCAGGAYFEDGQTAQVDFIAGSNEVTATQVTIGAALYWKLVGVDDAGAMSGSFVVPTPTPTPSDTGTSTPTPTDTGTGTPTGTLTVTATPTGTATGTVTTSVSPTVITTFEDGIFVQNLPSVTVADNTDHSDVRGNSVKLESADSTCPKFTKFTLSSSVITQGQEVVVTWKTVNAERVIWNNQETNLISSGSRTILPVKSMDIELVADNGKCSDTVTKHLSVVEALPWSTSTKLAAGTLIVEAVAIQLGVVQGNIWLSVAGLFMKKKKGAYGVVYDSVTKVPVPRAVVRLVTAENKIIDTSVSDALGIFRLSSRGGECKIVVHCAGYSFPSTVVKGPVDGGYSAVYLGEMVSASSNGTLSLVSIPLDPIAASAVKTNFAKVVSFATNYGNDLMRLLLVGGLLYSIYAAIAYPHIYNTFVLVFYALVVAGKEYLSGKATKVMAKVTDSQGTPMPGVELGLFDTEFDTLLYRTFTSKDGTYNFAVENKAYYLKVLDANYDIMSGNNKEVAMRIEANSSGERIRIIAEDLSIGSK